jgi:hypothetical protein
MTCREPQDFLRARQPAPGRGLGFAGNLPVKAGIQVQGAATLRRTLKRAEGDVGELKRAHAEVAKLVEVRSGPRTPRDSGALADSLRSSGTQSAAIVRAGGARTPYAGPVHWGWPSRNIHAQPWIDQTAEASMDVSAGIYMHAVESVLAKIEGAPGA